MLKLSENSVPVWTKWKMTILSGTPRKKLKKKFLGLTNQMTRSMFAWEKHWIMPVRSR